MIISIPLLFAALAPSAQAAPCTYAVCFSTGSADLSWHKSLNSDAPSSGASRSVRGTDVRATNVLGNGGGSSAAGASPAGTADFGPRAARNVGRKTTYSGQGGRTFGATASGKFSNAGSNGGGEGNLIVAGGDSLTGSGVSRDAAGNRVPSGSSSSGSTGGGGGGGSGSGGATPSSTGDATTPSTGGTTTPSTGGTTTPSTSGTTPSGTLTPSVTGGGCTDAAQTAVACATYAGQYGIPAHATMGMANWTKNSCTGAITYTGGCVDPASCVPAAQTPVSCATYAGSYGIPASATSGSANWTKNSCTGVITYTGGCYAPDSANCVNVVQTPVSCAAYAGSYGVPAGATVGSANWTKNSCTAAIVYTGGCSAPGGASNCVDSPQAPVSCATYAGSYGIPAGATQGDASWTKNTCTGAIEYMGGCNNPAACVDMPQTPVLCASYAGTYGIPPDATFGLAQWTQNTCTAKVTYLGGCTVQDQRKKPN
ncbi:MAG: hypothetical protein ACHQ51_14100 [Elusimicrobiota bacterium]